MTDTSLRCAACDRSLGRDDRYCPQCGEPTPLNDALCELSARHVRERRAPQTLPAGEVLALARSGNYADGPVRS